MTKSKQKTAPKPKKHVNVTASTRKLEAPKYKSFKLSKPIKHPGKKLPSSLAILRLSIKHLIKHKKVFLGVVFVYLVLTITLVQGFGFSTNINELRFGLEDLSQETGQFATGIALFTFLLTSANTAAGEAGGAYQSMVLVVISLVLIWTLRQTYAGAKITTKEAFYKSMYPLIPFILVLIVIGLQLIPLLVANFIATIVFAGLTVTALEQVLWGLIVFLLFLLSVYMVSSSIFALYIVSLPDMRPMQALRSARELVRNRRWTVLRKVLFLPFVLLAIAIILMLPIIFYATPLAEWSFFILTMLSLAVAHSYLYNLYREML